MTTLPAHLRELANKVCLSNFPTKGATNYEGYKTIMKYEARAAIEDALEWLYSHLCETAERGFDEKAYYAEIDRLFTHGDISDWQFDQWSKYFARWQHEQSAAQIQTLRVELVEAQNKIESMQLELAHGEGL